MCGIAGFLDMSIRSNYEERIDLIQRMTNTLYHRGPDSNGVWSDEDVAIALGHRRLSILDLSPLGHQPMKSENQRYMLVFNGEIYNFKELATELTTLGHKFRGGSDTEVMLAAFTAWGIEPAVQKFTGMFAFALWDRQEQLLHLGRDRIGEKPLYYGTIDRTFIFASELKALKTHPKWQGEIDRNALSLFFK